MEDKTKTIPAYNAKTGATTGEASPEYREYLKSLNRSTPTTINSTNLTPTTATNLPPPPTPTNTAPITNAVNETLSQAEAEQKAFKASQTKEVSDMGKLYEILGQEGAMIKTAAQDIGATERLKEYDQYTSDIENEERSLRDRISNISKTFTGTTAGASALEDKLRRESASYTADLAIKQNIAGRKYDRAMAIAKDKVEIELAPKKAELAKLEYIWDKNSNLRTAELQSIIDNKKAEIADEKKEKDKIEAYKVEAIKGGLKNLSGFDTVKTAEDALKLAAPFMATSDNQIVELKNGNTVVVDKKTGRVINNLGGGKAPSTVVQTVGGQPVVGYKVVEGDDPLFIAQQNGITVDQLKKLNPKVQDWNNIPAGATLNIPQPPEEAFLTYLKSTEGGSKLADTSIQKLDKGLTVLGQLGTLQANVQGVKTGPIIGAFKGANPWDTNGQTIKASLNAIVPNLARGVYGEVGVLTDNDIKVYSQTIPNLKSTEEVRNAVLYITLDMIGKSIKNTLNVNAAAGRDVSGFTDIYTEMEATKNSILQQIPGAQVPQAFNKTEEDPFLSQFSTGSINSAISNSDFFNQF